MATGRARRSAKIIVGLTCVLLIGGWGGYALLCHMLQSKLDRICAERRAAGKPATMDDILRRLAPVADSDNAAIPLGEAFHIIGNLKTPQIWDLDIDAESTWTEDGQHKIDAMLLSAEWQQIEALVREAAKRRSCRFAIDWRDGIGTLLPHLSFISNLNDALCIGARQAATQGNRTLAVERIANAFLIAAHLLDEPVAVSVFVSANLHTPIYSIIAAICRNSGFTEADLSTIAVCMAAEPAPRSAAALIADEMAFAYDAAFMRALRGIPLMDFSGFRATDELLALSRYELSPKALILSDALYYFTTMEPVEQAVTGPYNATVEMQIQTLAQQTPSYYPASALLLSGLKGLSRRWCAMEAARHIAQAAITIEQQRLTAQGYPERLDEVAKALLPAVPMDPFSQKPLVYQRSGEGYILYSVGPDTVDNAAAPDSDDITWPPRRDPSEY